MLDFNISLKKGRNYIYSVAEVGVLSLVKKNVVKFAIGIFNPYSHFLYTLISSCFILLFATFITPLDYRFYNCWFILELKFGGLEIN